MNFIPYYVYMYICCTVEINSTTTSLNCLPFPVTSHLQYQVLTCFYIRSNNYVGYKTSFFQNVGNVDFVMYVEILIRCLSWRVTRLPDSTFPFSFHWLVRIVLSSRMLVSHCGEYTCECKNIYSLQIRQIVANIWRMGLRMQFATNRNDRKMIARYS